MKVVFLNPHGVLLSARAAIMPANSGLSLSGLWRGFYLPAEMAMQAAFDPVAVSLVNRLCEKAGATVVFQSDWMSLGPNVIREKMVAEGIDERHLGEHWFCEWGRLSQGKHMISHWIERHGQSGMRWVSLDQAPIGRSRSVDLLEGFMIKDYRIACGLLNARDSEFGVAQVSDEDADRVIDAFHNDCGAAYAWLHGPNWLVFPTCAALLGYPGVRLADKELSPETAAERERLRNVVWRRLAEEAPPPREPPPEIDMDF